MTDLKAPALVGDGSRSVDALVTWPGGQLAIEVDGPTHFRAPHSSHSSHSSSCGPLAASTRLRDYILQQWGLQVLSIPVVGQQMHDMRSGAFQQHLGARLRQAGIPFAFDPFDGSGET
jgi:hypothetical protein